MNSHRSSIAALRLPRIVHPIAWWVWAIGLAAAASRTTNPLLLALVLAVIGIVVAARRTEAPWARAFKFYLLLGLAVIAIRVAFRILLGGDDTSGGHVLFTHTDSEGRPTAARFIAKKLWEWFAYPGPSLALVDELAHDFVAANYEIAPLVLRVNSCRSSRKALLALLSKSGVSAVATRWSPVGISVKSSSPVNQLPGFQEGLFQVQGEASQLVSYLLSPEKGERRPNLL